MAGRGPAPKTAATRQRRNASPGAAQLPADGKAKQVPELPQIGRAVWHPQTIAWWNDVWTDPASAEYANADKHGMFRLARLQDRFWKLSASNPALPKLSAEIRQLESKFGLSPLDRRRLQWEIEKGEEATERTAQRASRRAATRRTQTKGDPRDYLKAVP